MTWHTAFSSSFLPKFLKGKFDKHVLSNGTLSVCSFFTKVFLRGSILNWHFIVTFQDGISPLMVATANNRLNCVKLLLSEGALPYLKSNVSSSKSLCSSIMKIALSWSNYPSVSTFEQLFLVLLRLPLSCDSNDLGCPKIQKFGNVLLPRQKVMQMISETMPTSKKLPYLKV